MTDGIATKPASSAQEELLRQGTMLQLLQKDVGNRLLSSMPSDDFQQLAVHLEPMGFPRLFVFSEPNQVYDYGYFLEAGIGSIIARTQDGQTAEVGIFGVDGFTPAALALDSDADPFSIFMQVPGHGYRVQAAILGKFIDASSAFRSLVTRYAHTLSVQMAYTALANANDSINHRLARWILMCHDRTPKDRINLTHEFISVMLAVRRSSVTTALHVLEGKHLIYSERGAVTIRNRQGLEAFAGSAYGQPEAEYARLVGPLRSETVGPDRS